MTWIATPTFTSGNVLTAAQMNILADDLDETAPAKFTAAGQMFVSTGANAGAARTPTAGYEGSSGSTALTSYGDVSAPPTGPQVTVTTGTSCILVVGCRLWNSTAGAYTSMSSSIDATNGSFDRAWTGTSSAVNAQSNGSEVCLITGLSAGSHNFIAKFLVSAGTGTVVDRRVLVIPL